MNVNLDFESKSWKEQKGVKEFLTFLLGVGVGIVIIGISFLVFFADTFVLNETEFIYTVVQDENFLLIDLHKTFCVSAADGNPFCFSELSFEGTQLRFGLPGEEG